MRAMLPTDVSVPPGARAEAIRTRHCPRTALPAVGEAPDPGLGAAARALSSLCSLRPRSVSRLTNLAAGVG